MDTDSILAVGRVVERVVVALSGGLSLVMGWHLYLKGVEKKHVAEIQHDKTILRLRDVGPGAFFVVFGALILVMALGRSLIYDADNKKAQTTSSKPSFSYGSNLSRDISTADVIKAITTIEKNVQPIKVGDGVAWKEQGVRQAIEVLSKQKHSLLSDDFRQYPEYLEQKKRVISGNNPDFTNIDQETYSKIEQLETNTFGRVP